MFIFSFDYKKFTSLLLYCPCYSNLSQHQNHLLCTDHPGVEQLVLEHVEQLYILYVQWALYIVQVIFDKLRILLECSVVKHAVDEVVELLIFVAMGHFADICTCCHLSKTNLFSSVVSVENTMRKYDERKPDPTCGSCRACNY